MTPDGTIKLESKEDLLRPVAADTVSLTSRLLRVAAVGTLLCAMGLVYYLGQGTSDVAGHSGVNAKQLPTQLPTQSLRHTTHIDNADKKTISLGRDTDQSSEIADANVQDGSTEKSMTVTQGKSDTQGKLLGQREKERGSHLQTVKAVQAREVGQSQTSSVSQSVTQPTVIGPIYEPTSRIESIEENGNNDDHLQASVHQRTQSSRQQSPSTANRVAESNGANTKVQPKTLAQIPSIASLSSLPITEQLSSQSAPSDEIASLGLIESKPDGSILKSLINKSTGLSRTLIEDLSESLIPSLALSEVQLVPTYIKESQIDLLRK